MLYQYPPLTAENCALIALHSHPCEAFRNLSKDWETRNRRCHKEYIVLVSCKSDNKKLGWETVTTIMPNHIYGVARVKENVQAYHKPVDSNRQWDWLLEHIVILNKPVPVNAPVGQGHVSPRQEHMRAMELVNEQLKYTVCVVVLVLCVLMLLCGSV